jgi:pSer/pThr/pTyr-binding forkhead associated (FHA) protein
LQIISIRSKKDNDNDELNEKLVGKLFNLLNNDINNDEVTIVRSRKSNDIVIKDLSISTNHAKIIFNKGRFYLIDLQSKHGTYVNGKKLLIEKYNINIGTEIRFGRIVCNMIVLNDEAIVVPTPIVDEPESIKNMNYYENLLKDEHRYSLYKDQVEDMKKKRKRNDDKIFDSNNVHCNTDSKTDSNADSIVMKTYNNTSKRVVNFYERSRIIEPIKEQQQTTHDSIYSIGAEIFRNMGGNPLKKLGKNRNEEEANEPLQVKVRTKNLGLGADSRASKKPNRKNSNRMY